MAKYNYGTKFTHGSGRKVMYRYTNKKKSTKTLVYVSTKKPVKRMRGDSYKFSYKGKRK